MNSFAAGPSFADLTGNAHLQHYQEASFPDSESSHSAHPFAPVSQAQYAQTSAVALQRNTASPAHHSVPNAGQHTQSFSHPPQQYPMAAPPLNQSSANQQQQPQQAPADGTNNNNATIASPTSPQSPGAQSREQQRISLLLSINVDLLEEVNRLQQDGSGGAISPQQMMQLQQNGKDAKMASEEYIQCLRRVQANLAYMMPQAQKGQDQSKIQNGPAHMTPPRHMLQLRVKYEQLKELFPGWMGLESRMAANSASPTPTAQSGVTNGMGNPGA